MGSPSGASTGTTTPAATTSKPKPKPAPPPVKTWEDAYSAADAGSLGLPASSKPAPKPAPTPPPGAPGIYEAADAGSLGIPYTPVVSHAQVGRGNAGGEILDIQNKLTALGYDTGGADGVFGPKTEAAVRAYQAANGLTVDGIIGPQTHRFLDGQPDINAAIDAGSLYVPDAPPPTPPTPASGSDRRFYIEAAERADDPSILEDFDENLQAYNDSQKLPEITVGSDRRFYAQAADLKDDPSILEDFDQRLDDYNNFKNVIAQTYDSRVNDLMAQHGYKQAVAEDLVTLEFQNSDLPTHALPDQARGLNFENRNEGSDRRLYAMSDDPNALRDFDAGSPEYQQFRGAIGERFDAAVDEMVKRQGYKRDVAEHLVALQFGASGVPSHALPDGVNSFDPGRVLQQKHDVFDTANHAVDDRSITFSETINRLRGRDNGGDGFTATSDINAIVDNPDKFDPDVVATAIVLQNAINRPGNEGFKAQFESESLWQQVKDSDWNDWNSDSLVVNFVNAASGRPVSPAFVQRVWNEGPGVLEKIDNSLSELSIENQVRLAFTDRDQLLDNYKSFGGGAKDWVVDTAKLGIGLTALGTPGGADAVEAFTGTDVREVAIDTVLSTGETLLNDPDALAKGIVGWDQFVNDPWRWAGNQAPDIVLELLGTKGAGKVAKAFRAADAATDVAGTGRVLPRAQEFVDAFDAQFLRSDVVDGATTNYLKLQDGTFVNVVETADGGFKLDYPDGPPAPRTQDFRSDAPPPPRPEDFRSSAPPPPRAEDFISDALPPNGNPGATLGEISGPILPKAQDLIDADLGRLVGSRTTDGVVVNLVELADGDFVRIISHNDQPLHSRPLSKNELGSDPLDPGAYGSLQHINPRRADEPGYGSGVPNRSENCVNCVEAVIAHLQGGRATALPGLPDRSLKEIGDHYGSSFSEVSGRQEIADILYDAGPGAEGVVYGWRHDGTAHVFVGANLDGIVRFFDGQVDLPGSFDGYEGLRFMPIDGTRAGAVSREIPPSAMNPSGANNSANDFGRVEVSAAQPSSDIRELDFSSNEFSPSYQNGLIQGVAAADRGGQVIRSFRLGDDAPYDYAHVVQHHADNSQSILYEHADGSLEAGPQLDEAPRQGAADTQDVDEGGNTSLDEGLREIGLPTEGEVIFDPGKAKNIDEIKNKRTSDGAYTDDNGNEWKWDPIKKEWDVTLSDRGQTNYGHLTSGKNKNHVNVASDGHVTHQT